MSDINLEEIRDFMVEVALEAGKLIRDRTGLETYEDKKNSVDLVTQVDKNVETFIKSKLISKYPSYKFIGEESFEDEPIPDEPVFIVDPIDGTTNFIHTFKYSCTSLGFAINKKAVVGVVYNPHYDLLYTGVKGKGAYFNNVKLPVINDKLTLQKSLVAFEGGSEREGNNFEVKLATFKSLLSNDGGFIHGFRSFGSAAMNICHVASGELDAYWEGGCQSWDVCGASVVLEETGGRMVDGNKNGWEIPLDNRAYLCVRGASEQDQTSYIEEFWNNIQGELKY